MARLYITTPIYYVNGEPHIGHAHTTIMADVLRRSANMRGVETWLTTGTDEHGQKNQEAAERSGLGEADYLNRQSGRFRELFDSLDVAYDMFVRTSQPNHKRQVQEFESRLKAKNLLVQKPYAGLYCLGCEQFKKPSDLDEFGRCPDHLIVPEATTEINWFLRIEPFRGWLTEFVTSSPGWVLPQQFRNEVLGMLSQPLDDLCISRPKSRVSLGIELPFDSSYVTYVWFDALLNYLTNVGWPDSGYLKWWPHVEHLIGKDIIKTHCIYWPIMLKALDIEPPKHLWVHGYWIAEGGQKMSKSLGNAVDPVEAVALVGKDGLRYYLAKQMRGGSDAQISLPMIVGLYNIDLANKIGNLLSRVVKLTSRQFGGKVPQVDRLAPDDLELLQSIVALADREHLELTLNGIPALVQACAATADRLNQYVDTWAPWQMARNPGSADRLASLLYTLLDSLRLLFEMLYPVIPNACGRGLTAISAVTIPDGPRRHVFAACRLVPGSALDANMTLFPKVADL